MKKLKIFLAITALLSAIVAHGQDVVGRPTIFNETVQFNKAKAGVNATRLGGISAPQGVGGNFLTYVTLDGSLSLTNNVLAISGGASSNVWSISGNNLTTNTRFLGTTSNRSLNIRTNNVQRMKVDSLGNVGIGFTLPQTRLDVNGGFRDSTVISGYEYHANVGYSNRFTLNHAYYTLRLADSLVYGMFLDNSIDGKVIIAWQDAGAANAEEYALMAYNTGIRVGYNINNTTFVRGLTVENTLGTVISGEVAGTGYNTTWQDSTNTTFATFRNRRLGVGTADPQSILDVQSTASGVLIPRVTTTQRDAFAAPANGMIIYNTTDNKFQGYAAGAWADLN